MDCPEIPLNTGSWQHPKYVYRNNVSTQNLIMPERMRESVFDPRNLGYRLRIRKELIVRRTRVSDIAFVLAILGIIIVIIDTECQIAGVYNASKTVSINLRVITSVTTAGLLAAILMYHFIGIKLKLVSHGHTNWRMVITGKDIAKLAVELAVCAVHPLPFVTTAGLPMLVTSTTTLHEFTVTILPINSLFAILMFGRIYLFMRFLIIHSALFCDTTVQSLGAMSNVNINAQFVCKALMIQSPGVCLVSIMAIVLVIDSYSMRMCEYHTLDDNADTFFMQALWMTCVTFLTLGYGDVVPRTTCGRVLAIMTGMMGVGLMALCVAVLARKMEQTRGEKYVHTFVQQIKMDKTFKNAAAKVVTEFIRLCRLRRMGFDDDDSSVISHRCKLLHAVKTMKQSRYLRMQVGESLIGLAEINKNLNEVYDTTDDIRNDQEQLISKLKVMEHLLTSMDAQLKTISSQMTQKQANGQIRSETT